MSYYLLDATRRKFIGPIETKVELVSRLRRESGKDDLYEACQFLGLEVVETTSLADLEPNECTSQDRA